MSSISETLKRINERLDSIENEILKIKNSSVEKTDENCDKQEDYDSYFKKRIEDILDDGKSLINWERVYLTGSLLRSLNDAKPSLDSTLENKGRDNYYLTRTFLLPIRNLNNQKDRYGDKDYFIFPYNSIDELKKSAKSCLESAVEAVKENMRNGCYNVEKDNNIITYQGFISGGCFFAWANIYYENGSYSNCDLNLQIVFDSDIDY